MTTVLVGALGYFVDIYDLLLFTIVRVPSLRSLGVSEAALLNEGLGLLSIQMWGLLAGGILWGVLGDKRGRLSVLFGSILLYSVANIANAFVHSLEGYAFWRFVAGVGLAGELGAAITLVSEMLPARVRGYGTATVAGVGLLGAVAAALVGRYLPWRTAYIIGGVMGLILLATRLSMFESGMFSRTRDDAAVTRGNFFALFTQSGRFFRYLRCILIGVPIWFVVGILVAASPELGRQMGATGPVSAGDAVLATYVGLAVGDLSSGFLSQWVGSRKQVVALYLTATALLSAVYLSLSGPTPSFVYGLCMALGVAIGYWAVFVTIAAEQFGTNLRATVTTSVPNFVRGSVPLLTWSFKALQRDAGLSMSASARVVGLVCVSLAALSLFKMEETFGRELDFHE